MGLFNSTEAAQKPLFNPPVFISTQDFPIAASATLCAKNFNRTTARIHVNQTPINNTLAELGPVRIKKVRYADFSDLATIAVSGFNAFRSNCSKALENKTTAAKMVRGSR